MVLTHERQPNNRPPIVESLENTAYIHAYIHGSVRDIFTQDKEKVYDAASHVGTQRTPLSLTHAVWSIDAYSLRTDGGANEEHAVHEDGRHNHNNRD